LAVHGSLRRWLGRPSGSEPLYSGELARLAVKKDFLDSSRRSQLVVPRLLACIADCGERLECYSFAMRPLRTQVNRSILAAAVCVGIALPAKADNPIAKELQNKTKTEPEYYQIPNEHAAMHQAVIKARKTVGQFIGAVKHPATGQTDFEVKKPFVQGNEVEHIWLSDVQFTGSRFQGRVDNTPRKIRGLKVGQLVSVNPNEISDWVYIDNGKLVGGYTIRAHYNQLTPEQKKEFDRQADFRIN
jgi:uncharacterized protein YegJ (DUF2314 family)